MNLVEIAALFTRLGLLSFGGGTAVLAEMEREVVSVHGWLSSADFWSAYALGQLTPGPIMLFVIPLGYMIGGPAVATVATIAFLLPSSMLMLGALLLWRRVREAPWAARFSRSLQPITVGLVAAGAYSVGRASLTDVPSVAIATVALGLLTTRASQSLVVVVCGVAIAALSLVRP